MSKITQRFETKIKPTTITIDLPKTDPSYRNTFRESIGRFPLVWYNSYQIDTQSIRFMELAFTDNLPSINIQFVDRLNMIKDKTFPVDDTTITLFIHPRNQSNKPIFLDFKIVDFKIDKELNICFGILDVKSLYVKEFKSYSKKSSYQLYEQIAREIGLGFYSNIENTNDRMTWINTGDKVYEFMNKVLDNCYLSDKSSITGYVDYYYNFVFVDLQTELSRDVSQDVGVTNTGLEDIIVSKDSQFTNGLFLSNDLTFKDSNLYFDSYKILNKSSRVSITKGYQSVIKYYDQLAKDYLLFDLKSQNDPSEYKIPLNISLGDKNYTKQNLNFIYEGKMDTDNTHKNYSYAVIQNDRNMMDLEKIGLEIELPIPNYNLYKFQKLSVLISNQTRNVQQELINQRLSGHWLISNIRFRISEGKFKQIINLVRGDLSRPSYETKK